MTVFTWIGIATVMLICGFLGWLLIWGLIPMTIRACRQTRRICADLERSEKARGLIPTRRQWLRRRWLWFRDELFASYDSVTINGKTYSYDPGKDI